MEQVIKGKLVQIQQKYLDNLPFPHFWDAISFSSKYNFFQINSLSNDHKQTKINHFRLKRRTSYPFMRAHTKWKSTKCSVFHIYPLYSLTHNKNSSPLEVPIHYILYKWNNIENAARFGFQRIFASNTVTHPSWYL